MAGVAHALEHMHDRRVIYRDLKPESLTCSCSHLVSCYLFDGSRFACLTQESASGPQRLPQVDRCLVHDIHGYSCGLAHVRTIPYLTHLCTMHPTLLQLVLSPQCYSSWSDGAKDMGSAKFASGSTYTIVGTPDYFAPEMVKARQQPVEFPTLSRMLCFY